MITCMSVYKSENVIMLYNGKLVDSDAGWEYHRGLFPQQ